MRFKSYEHFHYNSSISSSGAQQTLRIVLYTSGCSADPNVQNQNTLINKAYSSLRVHQKLEFINSTQRSII